MRPAAALLLLVLRINKAFVALLLKGRAVNIAICRSLKDDLNRQLETGWAYIQPKIEASYRRGLAQVLVCEQMK